MDLNIKNVLNEAALILDKSGSLSPRLDSEVLLAFLLNKDRSYLFMYPERIIDREYYLQYMNAIHQRMNGKPVAYLVGKQDFMGLDFFVNENVLIPRPDTEILIETILQFIKANFPSNVKILDIGCGSGAIAVSLAHYAPKSMVTTVDVSPKALEIARKNAKLHSLENRITFLEGDLFNPIEDQFHIIVSNPPYIPSDDIPDLQIEVSRYEPRLALDGGEDGLDFYRKIIYQVPRYLYQNGFLFLEIGYNQGNAVEALLNQEGVYEDISIIKDLSGLDRVVKAKMTGKKTD